MANITEKSVLALGFFDSIHKGHRYLLEQGKKVAKEHNTKFTILTFNDDFHINLGRTEKQVFLLNERIDILKGLGYEDILVLNPTKEFLNQTEYDFMDYLLTLNPIAIIAGNDYSFGKYGKGDISILKEFMINHKVDVREINLQKFYQSKISTSGIKNYLTKGEIQKANRLLQNKYFVSGSVVKGRGLGKKIGIPTANIEVNPRKHLPREGIYKTSTEVDGKTYKSITNVGIHPTFEDKNFNIETLILDFNGNIYQKNIKVYFELRIRDIIKFNNANELVEQINKDINAYCN